MKYWVIADIMENYFEALISFLANYKYRLTALVFDCAVFYILFYLWLI
jgi:hypothetical protein